MGSIGNLEDEKGQDGKNNLLFVKRSALRPLTRQTSAKRKKEVAFA